MALYDERQCTLSGNAKHMKAFREAMRGFLPAQTFNDAQQPLLWDAAVHLIASLGKQIHQALAAK